MGAARPQRWDFARHVIGVIACLLLGWFGIAQGMRIPILADASYGFHEFGHLMTWFLPEVYRAMMGSVFQVLIPLGLAGYFLLFHRDLLAVALMLGWTAVSAHATALYVADAPTQLIRLSAGHTAHDWGFVLGGQGLDRMAAADELAWVLQAAALICILAGLGFAAWGSTRALMEKPKVAEADAYLERRPVLRDDGDAWRPEDLRDSRWATDSTASNWDGSGR